MESTFAVPVCFYWEGNLGEQEVLWGHEPISECFHGFLEFSQTLTSVSITQRKCYINISFLENSPQEIIEDVTTTTCQWFYIS